LSSTSSSSALLCQKKQSGNGDAATDQVSLIRLFDRDHYLLAKSEPGEAFEEIGIDLRLLQGASNFDIGGTRITTSKHLSQSQRPSPHRQHTIRSIFTTQLTDRQSIVSTIHIHPNWNIGNQLGSMSFPSSIRDNYHLADIQDTQTSNLFLPTWAMLPINTVPDLGFLGCAFLSILQEAASLKNRGVSIEQIIETHPNIAALFDEEVFRNSGILSKWAAGMVHSVSLKGMNRQYKWRGIHPLANSFADRVRQYLLVLRLHVCLLVPNALDDLAFSWNLQCHPRVASSDSEPALYTAC
jgi:hypothetical protein